MSSPPCTNAPAPVPIGPGSSVVCHTNAGERRTGVVTSLATSLGVAIAFVASPDPEGGAVVQLARLSLADAPASRAAS
jgi:hypothetical protein